MTPSSVLPRVFSTRMFDFHLDQNNLADPAYSMNLNLPVMTILDGVVDSGPQDGQTHDDDPGDDEVRCGPHSAPGPHHVVGVTFVKP